MPSQPLFSLRLADFDPGDRDDAVIIMMPLLLSFLREPAASSVEVKSKDEKSRLAPNFHSLLVSVCDRFMTRADINMALWAGQLHQPGLYKPGK